MDLVLLPGCRRADAVDRAVDGIGLVHRCFRSPPGSRIRGYQSSTVLSPYPGHGKDGPPLHDGLVPYGQLSLMLSGASSSCRRHYGLLPMQYRWCRATATAEGKPSSLAARQRCVTGLAGES